MTLDIDDYKVIEWNVSKGIEDYFWVLKAKIDKHTVPEFFKKIKATAVDHNGIRRTPFVGIIPAIDYELKTAANKADIIGYEYAWYLTVQHIPSNLETIDIDQNPSETIIALLGGNDWEKTTGIEPYRINDVTAWDDATDPIKKQFTFREKTLRWSAIVEIADYCNFVFVVKWREVAGDWRPCAYFVHEDDIDTGGIGIDLPGEMTITEPDDYLINDVEIKDEPLYKYNRVLCIGYSLETNEYFYSTAQTAAVAAGTEIPREYTFTDPKLNTKAKTEAKAQELLELFQESSIIYTAKFKNRMDLELYQTVSFGGYPKIDSNEMRITKITYKREAVNDTVTIEFCKNQAIQQLHRLNRVMRTRTHYETFISDMWERSGAYAQLIEDRPINFQGWGAYNIRTIYGSQNSDMGLWGWDTENERGREFLRWHNFDMDSAIHRYIEIKEDLYINNDQPSLLQPRIYFDITKDAETYIESYRGLPTGELLNTIEFIVGGRTLLSCANYTDEEEDDFVGMYADLIATKDIRMSTGKIKGDDYFNTDLRFWDHATGTKTLKQLAEGGGLWLESTIDGEDFAQLKLDRAVNLQENFIRKVKDPELDQDAATKYWCEQTFGGSGLWEKSGSYAQLINDSPIDMQYFGLAHCTGISGSTSGGELGTNRLVIDFRGDGSHKIWHTDAVDNRLKYETFKAHLFSIQSTDICQVHSTGLNMANGKYIKADSGNLMFWDAATGFKTLKQLATGGEAGAYLPLAGGQMQGPIDMGGQNITNIEDILASGYMRTWEYLRMEYGQPVVWGNPFRTWYGQIYATSGGDVHIYPGSSSNTVHIHGNLDVSGNTT